MKILYVHIVGVGMMGVEKKIQGQFEACKQAGIDMEFLVVFVNCSSSIQCEVRSIEIRESNPMLREAKIFSALKSEINCDSWDAVILRKPHFSPFFLRCFSNKNFKLILEHHTLEVPELIRLKCYLTALSETFFAILCFGQVDGIIAMTDEIAAYERSRGFSKPQNIKVISNGIEISKVAVTGQDLFDGKHLRLVFVAAKNHAWHGLDRLINSLEAYSGDLQIELHLICPHSEISHIQVHHPYVRLVTHGALFGEDFDSVIAKMHLGVASLALDRKGMAEACTLKVREYMARGLPFIMGHNDPDLPRSCDFYLKLDAINGSFDFSLVEMFIGELDKGAISQKMHDYAVSHLDWKAKLREYVSFAEGVVIGDKK